MTRPTPQQLERLMEFGAATVHEACAKNGAMDSALKPLDPSFRFAGVALTVDAMPRDNLVLHHALTIARPGDVLVVDAKGYTEAGPWGDVMTLAAQITGLAALVIDGSVRDSASIVAMNFPVFSRGVCIKGTTKNQPGRVNVPVVCGGVAVNPGDIVIGDRDGLGVLPPGDAAEAIRPSEARLQKEGEYRELLRKGQNSVQYLDLTPALSRVGLL